MKDIRPGPVGSFPNTLANVNGTLYFAADDGSNGPELWKSDGTEAGTALVKDVQAGSFGAGAVPRLTNVGGTLFFAGNDSPTFVYHLWKSDGTPAGTHRVADIAAIGGSLPEPLAGIGPLLLFSARADATGWKLYAVPTAALGDGDGDGLEDATEVALGTDPDDADSDDDGLTDGAEVNTFATDPLDADTDGDSYSDGVEITAGTDPLDPEDFPPTVPLSGPIGVGLLAALLLAGGSGATARARATRSRA